MRHGERKYTTEGLRTELTQVEARQRVVSEELAAIETPAREKILKSRAAGNRPPAPLPIARWDFATDLQDQLGSLHGEPRPGAEVRDGRLVVDGKTGFVTSAPIPVRLKAKTLEAWVQLTTLQQAGGGVIGVQTTDGVRFDSIVFAEREPNRWMAGSEGYARYKSFNGPEETEAVNRPVHVAIVYAEDGTITAYRDGQPYASHTIAARRRPSNLAPPN